MTTTTKARPVSIFWACVALLLGVGAAAVTVRILFDDVLQGAPVTITHWTSAAVLIMTLFAGHLVGIAYRSRAALGVIGFAGLFVLGTAYIVVTSGMRNAERGDDKASTIEHHNGLVASKETAIRLAQKRIADWTEERHAELHGLALPRTGRKAGKAGCGIKSKCKALDELTKDAQARLEQLERERDTLGPKHRPNAGYANAATIFAALSGDPASAPAIEAWLLLVMPYVGVVLNEIGTVIFLHFALYGLTHAAQTHAVRVPVQSAPTAPSSPPRRRRVYRKDQARADVIAFARPQAQHDLADRWGVGKSMVSQWLTEWDAEGLIEWYRDPADGRTKLVCARRAALRVA